MSSLLSQLSQETAATVAAARDVVVCVGSGKARPRTGLVVAPGEVATVAMVAEIGEAVPVHGPTGEIEAEVVGFDASSGIALLSAPGLDRSATVDDAAASVGALGVTIACPVPDGHEARLSMIRCVGGPTRLRGGRRVGGYIQTDSPRFSGFTASVLFSPTGGAIGMTMPAHRREESWLLPMSEIIRIVGELREGTSVGTGYLGVQATAVELPTPVGENARGLLVTGVETDSPAEAASLQVGSFIVAVGETPTPTIEDLYDALAGVREGQRMDVTLATTEGSTRIVAVELVLRS